MTAASNNSSEQLEAAYKSLLEQTKVRLFRHRPRTMQDRLSTLAQDASQYAEPDYYGSGELIESLEMDMARLFGKPAGLFIPSGTMAQSLALRLVCDFKQNPHFVIHRTSHLQLHEHFGYQHLWQLSALIAGQSDRPLLLKDIQTLPVKPAAILIELPMREIGGQLPTWDQLTELSQWAREQQISLHLDGARIWSCATAYGKSFIEISRLFDVIYLSFYKDLDAISGAMLLADKALLDEARIWRRRCGGDLIHHYPALLSARVGLQKHLDKMPEYIAKTKQIVDLFKAHDCFRLIPKQPLTNLFHLQIEMNKSMVLPLLTELMRKQQVAILPAPRNPETDICRFEITIGDSQQQLSVDGWSAAIGELAKAINAIK